MSEHVILRDLRLTGNMPGGFTSWWHNLNQISVYGSIHHSTTFSLLRDFFREHGRMHTLFILCHGYAGSSEVRQQSGDFGGGGLQLGLEGLTHGNVSRWSSIRGYFDNIVVYACAAANTESGAEFTTQDGQYLMGALAIHTNTTVYAADRIQWYNPANFDFGSWEGQLMRFPPAGTAPSRVSRVPVDLSQMVR